jgi:hypothetical protein
MTNRETIEAERRRKGSGPEGKRRAQKPSRRREESSPRSTSQQTPTGGGSSGTPPSGKMRLPLWLAIPLVLLYIVFQLFSGGDSGSQVSESQPPATQFPEVVLPTSEAAEVALPPAGEGESWLVMPYQDAGGNSIGVTPVEGESFTFGSDPIEWQEQYAAPGQYIVGFIIEDLDGNTYPVYTQVTVE